jgi:hypothetical protein
MRGLWDNMIILWDILAKYLWQKSSWSKGWCSVLLCYHYYQVTKKWAHNHNYNLNLNIKQAALNDFYFPFARYSPNFSNLISLKIYCSFFGP